MNPTRSASPVVAIPAAAPQRAIPRPSRDRVLAVVLAVVAILVAGGLGQVGERLAQARDRVYLDVAMDQRARLATGATGAFVDVRVGDRLMRRNELMATAGRFVVVDLRTWAETSDLPSIGVELHWQGNTYKPVYTDNATPPAGFTSVRSSVFEVPAEAVNGFSVAAGRVEIIQSHQHFLRMVVPDDPNRINASRDRSVTLTTSTVTVTR